MLCKHDSYIITEIKIVVDSMKWHCDALRENTTFNTLSKHYGIVTRKRGLVSGTGVSYAILQKFLYKKIT